MNDFSNVAFIVLYNEIPPLILCFFVKKIVEKTVAFSGIFRYNYNSEFWDLSVYLRTLPL